MQYYSKQIKKSGGPNTSFLLFFVLTEKNNVEERIHKNLSL